MPQLTIRGIEPGQVQAVVAELVEDLAKIMDSPTDYFTIDCISTISFENGHLAPTFPFVQVGWFDRGQHIQDLSAKAIDRHFKSAGIEALEVVFIPFIENNYYSGGQHY